MQQVRLSHPVKAVRLAWRMPRAQLRTSARDVHPVLPTVLVPASRLSRSSRSTLGSLMLPAARSLLSPDAPQGWLMLLVPLVLPARDVHRGLRTALVPLALQLPAWRSRPDLHTPLGVHSLPDKAGHRD
jgi:hypothetical protein